MNELSIILLISLSVFIFITIKGWYDLAQQEKLIEEQERTIRGLQMTIEVLKRKKK